MAKGGQVEKGVLAARAVPGAEFAVRVQPAARAETLSEGPEGLSVSVTAPAEDGKANAAVARVLARALGVAPSRLRLVAGATARSKRFRLE